MSSMSYIRNNVTTRSYKRMRYLMGTFLSVEVFHAEESKAKEAIENTFSEVKRIESFLSRFKENSQVYKINRRACHKPEAIDKELFYLIERCLEFSEKTRGAFDITVGPLMDLWSRAARINCIPDEAEIARAISCVGYQNIILDKENRTIFFKVPLRLDLGAAGKGYALDRAVAVLREGGVDKARLDFGGQLYYLNLPEDKGECAAIRDPLYSERMSVTLDLNNQSLATTANYERNFTIREKVYSHILNPLDGYPCNSAVLSASAVSPCALEADILSTAAFMLGKVRCSELLECTVEALLIMINRDDVGAERVTVLPEQSLLSERGEIREFGDMVYSGSVFS